MHPESIEIGGEYSPEAWSGGDFYYKITRTPYGYWAMLYTRSTRTSRENWLFRVINPQPYQILGLLAARIDRFVAERSRSDVN
jgi:hypothetical protein